MTPNYESRIQQFVEDVGDMLQPASFASLDQLKRLRLPEPVTEFYRRFEPTQTLCNGQDIRIHTIADIVEWNSKYVGLYTAPHGYVVFASNGTGDAYAYDINVVNADGHPRIVLFSHEWVSIEMPAEDLAKLAKPVAVHFGEFLDQFWKDEVDEECIQDID